MPWNPATKVVDRVNPDFTGTTVWQQDLGANYKIVASRHDYHDQDLANAISACLNLDGINAMRADLDMGSNSITNIDDMIAAGDVVIAGNVGIGGTPSEKLEVDGDIKVTDYGVITPTVCKFNVASQTISGPIDNVTLTSSTIGSSVSFNTNSDFTLTGSEEIDVPTDGLYRITAALQVEESSGTLDGLTMDIVTEGGDAVRTVAAKHTGGAAYATATLVTQMTAGQYVALRAQLFGSSPTSTFNFGFLSVERILKT